MPSRTIPQAIEDAAAAEPTRGFRFVPETGVPGFIGPTTGPADGSEESFSFAAIERMSARTGGALQALGLRRGDRLAIVLPRNDDFILCFLGALRAGIVPVPLYPPMALGRLQAYLDNTRHIVAKSGARALVTTSKIKRLLGTVQAACPALEQVVAVEGIRDSNEPLRPEKPSLGDVAFLQFTSGSTSRPKGVVLTHDNIAANVECIMKHGLCLGSDDLGVSWLPLYHDMGLVGFVLAPLYFRIPVVLVPTLLFLKRPITWFQAMVRHGGTASYAPNFAYGLCVKRIRSGELLGIDLSRWRVAGCGAEPIRPETLESFSKAFAPYGFRRESLLPSYGMAEASLAVTLSALGRGATIIAVDGPRLWATGEVHLVAEDADNAVRLVSCGREFPGHVLRIFDPADDDSARPLPERVVGEIRIAGPSVMGGYWEDAERTREAFAGPFLRTGDLGFIHDEMVYICGRSKDIVIVNGRNYYPQDMEWEASLVDGVRKGNVVAFGARDPSGLERDRERVVLAFEVKEPERLAQAAALVSAVRAAVQDGMGLTVDDVIALPPGALPKTSSGKLQRGRTRELYETGELMGRASKRDAGPIDMAKHTAASQLSYLKLAVLGSRRPKP
ncbi:MAG: fatty acyl-AMP ligase [Polyangiaceae bacterium]|jgi:acyl-CoA synthetase (AMP-forming)/AMP-acid ligase II